MSHEEDIDTNRSSNAHIDDVVRLRLGSPTRRKVLKGTGAWAALSFVGAPAALPAACGRGSEPAAAAPARQRPNALGFAAVAKSTEDRVVVASGYSAQLVLRLGDRIAAGVAAYRNDGTDAAASFAYRAGDHHDGMHYFGLGAGGKYDRTSSNRGLLSINHEAITSMFLHPNGVTTEGTGSAQRRTVADEVLREFYAHGVSIVEVRRDAQTFAVSYRQDSRFSRRIHTLTPMLLSGPAGGTPHMVTKYSPDGRHTRGTVDNCAHGHTPWGASLSCEENWAGYFRRIEATDNPNRTAKELTSFARYAVRGNGRELWATLTPDTPDDLYGRWNAEVTGATAADDYRNGPTPSAGTSRSTPSIRPRCRASAPRWAALRTKAPGPRNSKPASRWSDTWAATRATSKSTSTCRTGRGIRRTPAAG